MEEWVPTTVAGVTHKLGDNYATFEIVKETSEETGDSYNHLVIRVSPAINTPCDFSIRINGYREFETGNALVELGKQLIATFANLDKKEGR